MIRNRYILLWVVLLAFAFTSCKKNAPKSQEVLKAQKIAFFTQKLDLTPEEAGKFWPLYNEYWSRKHKIIDDKRAAMKYCSENMKNMSEEEIAKYDDMYINFQKQETDLLIEFSDKFEKVMPASKVFKLYLADYEFKSYLLQQIKKSGE